MLRPSAGSRPGMRIDGTSGEGEGEAEAEAEGGAGRRSLRMSERRLCEEGES